MSIPWGNPGKLTKIPAAWKVTGTGLPPERGSCTRTWSPTCTLNVRAISVEMKIAAGALVRRPGPPGRDQDRGGIVLQRRDRVMGADPGEERVGERRDVGKARRIDRDERALVRAHNGA